MTQNYIDKDNSNFIPKHHHYYVFKEATKNMQELAQYIVQHTVNQKMEASLFNSARGSVNDAGIVSSIAVG